MQLEKLEKLSCLHLDPNLKEGVKKSLQGVFEMMEQLESISMPKLLPLISEATQLVEDKYQIDNLVKKEDIDKSLHIEDGYFLAPKVIKK